MPIASTPTSRPTSGPTCPACGAELVLRIEPQRFEPESTPVLADPPFRYVCDSPGCVSRR